MYDVIIIGLGPAGYSAGIYCSRYKLKTLIIGKEKGGAITWAHNIKNYPSYKNISGIELAQKLEEQVKDLGIKIIQDNITKLKKGFIVTTEKSQYKTKSIILATGAYRKTLKIPGEKEFTGKGISYCYTCDTHIAKHKTIAVIGAGNAAALAIQLLSKYAKKIYWLVRSEIRADPSNEELALKPDKTEVLLGVNVKQIKGDKTVSSVVLDNNKQLKVEAVFIEAGTTPSTILTKELKIKTNKQNYIITDKEQKTNKKGVFAAGDCTDNTLKQIITAAAEGAKAANSAYNYIKGEK